MNTQQRKALEALISSKTRKEAAERAQCGVDTLRRYMLDPVFREQYERRQNEIMDESVSNARKKIAVALDALTEILNDGEAAPTVRVSAARSLLEFGIRLVETQELAKKIERLEQYMNDREYEKGGER